VVDTDDARIVARTGIRERRFVEEGEDCVTLAIEAYKEALEHSKLFGDAIGSPCWMIAYALLLDSIVLILITPG
jgi:3-oxoacyl-[acyl-carrier-protein] synthase III